MLDFRFAPVNLGAWPGGCSSVVERKLPKLDVVGSIPIARSSHFLGPIPSSVRLQRRVWRVARPHRQGIFGDHAGADLAAERHRRAP